MKSAREEKALSSVNREAGGPFLPFDLAPHARAEMQEPGATRDGNTVAIAAMASDNTPSPGSWFS